MSDAGKELCRFDGRISNRVPGWQFLESKGKGELVYVPFEGYYEDKGGRLQSPVINLPEVSDANNYYELTFRAKTNEQCYWWVDYFDAAGQNMPDCNSAVYPGESRDYRQVFVTPPRAAAIQLSFLSQAGVEVSDLAVRQITCKDAAQWCDELYAELPPLKFQPPAGALKLAPKTAEALKSGKPWRVVMLGDSIVNDTYTSVFQALFKREFPGANFDFIISVRGSTGCWFYREEANFLEYVAKYQPDLVMIGGISNKYQPEDIEAIGKVIEMSRGLGAEVILMSPPYAFDWRADASPGQQWSEQLGIDSNYWSLINSGQKALVKKMDVAFFNMTDPCNDYVANSGKPLGYFNRDKVHNNDRGKQIIGRVLVEYFKSGR